MQHCDRSSVQSFWLRLVKEGAMGRQSLDLDAFGIKMVQQMNFEKNAKGVPRVRIELTAFRLLVFVWLWDWRATYCATEAHSRRGKSQFIKLCHWLACYSRESCAELLEAHAGRVFEGISFDLLLVRYSLIAFMSKFAPLNRSLRGLMDKASAS